MFKSTIKKIINKLFSEKKIEPEIDEINISKKLISKYLPKSPLIIDCGAHIGVDSMQLSEISDSTIFSFEPVPDLYKKLVDNTRTFKNIKCFQLALSNHNGYADFYVSSGTSDASGSLLKPKEHINDHPDVLFNEQAKVECIKLDDWAKKNNITKIDLLWLDMQGFEQAMLEQSEYILPTVTAIHTEVSMKETYEGVKCYPEFKRFLEEKGFEMVLEAIPDGYDMGNVLFIRK